MRDFADILIACISSRAWEGGLRENINPAWQVKAIDMSMSCTSFDKTIETDAWRLRELSPIFAMH